MTDVPNDYEKPFTSFRIFQTKGDSIGQHVYTTGYTKIFIPSNVSRTIVESPIKLSNPNEIVRRFAGRLHPAPHIWLEIGISKDVRVCAIIYTGDYYKIVNGITATGFTGGSLAIWPQITDDYYAHIMVTEGDSIFPVGLLSVHPTDIDYHNKFMKIIKTKISYILGMAKQYWLDGSIGQTMTYLPSIFNNKDRQVLEAFLFGRKAYTAFVISDRLLIEKYLNYVFIIGEVWPLMLEKIENKQLYKEKIPFKSNNHSQQNEIEGDAFVITKIDTESTSRFIPTIKSNNVGSPKRIHQRRRHSRIYYDNCAQGINERSNICEPVYHISDHNKMYCRICGKRKTYVAEYTAGRNTKGRIIKDGYAVQ